MTRMQVVNTSVKCCFEMYTVMSNVYVNTSKQNVKPTSKICMPRKKPHPLTV